jgi:outer membrane murein-binding lipoprotein Lpp
MAEPESILLRKLNEVIGWQKARGRQLDQMAEDVKELRASVWSLNNNNMTRLSSIVTTLDERVSTLEVDREDASKS